MATVALAWGCALACCVAAALFGQTARTASRSRRRSPRRRVGLFLSMSGPWLAVLLAAGYGHLTGAWLTAAAAATAGVVLAALLGLALTPR